MTGEVAYWAAVATAAVAGCLMLSALVLGPIGRALGDRIRGRSQGAELEPVVADLDRRLAEVEATQARLEELEERLDFTERMLALPRRPTTPVPGD